MTPEPSSIVLWRVVYNAQTNRLGGGWDAGPWHPDRGRVEHFAAWLRGLGHHCRVQNNGAAGPLP